MTAMADQLPKRGRGVLGRKTLKPAKKGEPSRNPSGHVKAVAGSAARTILGRIMADPAKVQRIENAWLDAATNRRTVIKAVESWARINLEIGANAHAEGPVRPVIIFVSSWDPMTLRAAAHRALPLEPPPPTGG